MTAIDLNADLGELPGPEGAAIDDALLAVVSSVNVACGGHAGTRESMRRVCSAAGWQGVSVGAHVSYPDPDGFGRRTLDLPERVLRDSLTRQIGDLQDNALAGDTTVDYVKPHGALYHDAADDPRLADMIIEVAAAAGIAVLTLPDRHLHQRAQSHGIAAFTEAFADRAYRDDGALVPRSMAGAVITDEDVVAQRVVAIARREPIVTQSDSIITLAVDSVCLHGDTPGAVATAARIARRLHESGIQVRSFVPRSRS